MKLELKHLAPYLPYKLQMYCETMNGCETFKWTLQPNNIDDVLGFQNKPILRPLVDLTTEINHDGEEFTPLDIIQLHHNVHIDPNGVVSEGADEYGIKWLPYEVTQFLFKWNFDVFGLIEKGLAIDINTIKHP